MTAMNDHRQTTATAAINHDDEKNTLNYENDDNTMEIHDKISAAEQDDKQTASQASAAVTASSAASIQIQQVTERALHFLSNASNETLGACLVGLGATTYFVLGRVGLLLIGMVSGIALHASWDSDNSQAGRLSAREADQKKRREIGLEVVQRVFQWKDGKDDAADADTSEDEVKALASKTADFSAFRPDTAAALTVFTDAIIRDYVKYARLHPHLLGTMADHV